MDPTLHYETWWLPGFLYHQGCQDLRKGNCPKRKLKVLSFHVPILPSELVSGIQEHVDAWCLAVSKHTLEDDLYVSWIFWVPNLCNDSVLHCPLLYVNSQVSILRMDFKMDNIWDSLGAFQNCEELRIFFKIGKHSGVAEGSVLTVSNAMLLYNLLPSIALKCL